VNGKTVVEKTIGGAEAAAVLAAGKHAGEVGYLITAAEGAHKVVQATVDAAKQGIHSPKDVQRIENAVTDAVVRTNIGAAANILTAGAAGGATDVIYNRSKEAIGEYGQTLKETATALAHGHMPDTTALDKERQEFERKNIEAAKEAVKATTPVWAANNVIDAAKEAAAAIREEHKNASFFDPKVSPEKAVGTDGKPAIQGYKDIQMLHVENGGKPSSDPALAAKGVIKARDPEAIKQAANTVIAHEKEKAQKILDMSGSPDAPIIGVDFSKLTTEGKIAHGALAELPAYKKQFDIANGQKSEAAKTDVKTALAVNPLSAKEALPPNTSTTAHEASKATPAKEPAEPSTLDKAKQAALAVGAPVKGMVTNTTPAEHKPDTHIVAVAANLQGAKDAAKVASLPATPVTKLTDSNPKSASPGPSIVAANTQQPSNARHV
jgi:hypothetical protein